MASREQNEAGLLKQTLARNAAPRGACLEPEVLAAYFDHSLAADEVKMCDVHLAHCPACREQLAAMVRAEEPPEVHGRELEAWHGWLTDWRWLTAGAVVMLLIAVWIVRRPEKIVRVSAPANEPQPLVALKKVEPASSTLDEITRSKVKRVEPNTATGSAYKTQRAKDNKAVARSVPRSPAAPETAAIPVAPSENGRERKQGQLSDSLVANQISNAASGERDLRHTVPLAKERSTGGGHAIQMQQLQGSQAQTQPNQIQPGQTTQSVTVNAAAPVLSSGRNSVAATTGAPAPSVVGGVAGSAPAKGNLETESTNEKKMGRIPVTKTRAAEATAVEVQALEQRASGKVIDTPNPKFKWRFDTAGFVERSTDGGATWNGQEVDPSGGLVAGWAPDEKVCWVVGRNGTIYVTKDAMNWTKVKPPPNSGDLVEVSAKNASSATVSTSDGRRFSTHSRGKKWKQESTQGSNPN